MSPNKGDILDTLCTTTQFRDYHRLAQFLYIEINYMVSCSVNNKAAEGNRMIIKNI